MEKRSTVRKCLKSVKDFTILAGIFSIIPIVFLAIALIVPWAEAENEPGEHVEGYFVGDVEPATDEDGYEIEGEYIIDGQLLEMTWNGTVIYDDDDNGDDDEPKKITIIVLIMLLILCVFNFLLISLTSREESDYDEE